MPLLPRARPTAVCRILPLLVGAVGLALVLCIAMPHAFLRTDTGGRWSSSAAPLVPLCPLARGHQRFSVATPSGARVWVVCPNDRPVDLVCNSLALGGVWEGHLGLLLHHHVGRLRRSFPAVPVRFVDVGSNVGVHAFAMSLVVESVLAIEALPANVAALHEARCFNQALSRNLELVSAAVGNATGPPHCAIMSRPDNVNDGVVSCDPSLFDLAVGSVVRDGSVIRSRVDMTTLDALVMRRPDWATFVYVVKIDIEGGELEAMRGAVTFLGLQGNAPKLIMSECSRASNMTGYAAFLRGFGFTMFSLLLETFLESNEAVLHYQTTVMKRDQEDVLFVHDSWKSEVRAAPARRR